jgi:MFS family permease
LVICTDTSHTDLLISVFPYSGFLVVKLVESATVDNAGVYSGVVASSFMVGRAVTSLMWGQVADRYGRTTVLYLSLALSSLFSLLFGVAPTFALALVFRFLMGCSNGTMSALKTIVSELADGDEKKEARSMSLVIGTWSLGFLVSPVLSGALAEPIKQYPEAAWLREDWIGVLLQRFPFLLPNLLGAAMCMTSAAMMHLFVRETLDTSRHPRHIVGDVWCRVRAWIPYGFRYETLPGKAQHYSGLHLSEPGETESSTAAEEDDLAASPLRDTTLTSVWARKNTRICLWIYWAFSFVGISIDEAFPLFCVSHQTGFGLSEKTIGKVLSLCGLIFVACQYPVSSVLYDRFGLLGSLRIGTVVSSATTLLLPLSVILNKGATSGTLRWTTFWFLGIVMALHQAFGLAFHTNIAVLTNRTVPPSQRATMNGISQVGGSISKGLGPTFAGGLVSLSVFLFGKSGSVLIFGTIGLMCAAVAIPTFTLMREDSFESIDQESEIELSASES